MFELFDAHDGRNIVGIPVWEDDYGRPVRTRMWIVRNFWSVVYTVMYENCDDRKNEEIQYDP